MFIRPKSKRALLHAITLKPDFGESIAVALKALK
jgi:hypothetical protein